MFQSMRTHDLAILIWPHCRSSFKDLHRPGWVNPLPLLVHMPAPRLRLVQVQPGRRSIKNRVNANMISLRKHDLTAQM